MTDTIIEHADTTLHRGEPLIEMADVGKTYGAIRALRGVDLTVNAGEVACVLGDNGAGKSTLIKIMSGLHPHSEGNLKVDGQETHFSSPREALDRGIATVYQDLAVVSLMEVWRNFFLGSEISGSKMPLAPLKIKRCARSLTPSCRRWHRRQGHQPADRDTLRRSAPVRGDRPGGVLRGAGAHPRRANRSPRRQAVRRRPQVHRWPLGMPD